jgi:hypothetical protein
MAAAVDTTVAYGVLYLGTAMISRRATRGAPINYGGALLMRVLVLSVGVILVGQLLRSVSPAIEIAVGVVLWLIVYPVALMLMLGVSAAGLLRPRAFARALTGTAEIHK